MRTRLLAPALVLALGVATLVPPAALAADEPSSKTPAQEIPAVLQFRMNSLAGEPVELSRYQGRVLLIVNVASRCGYTKQYAGLQALHEKYSAKGLSVLGFPANDFGAQEPGTSEEIATFCKKNFGVEFDMFEKITVVGDDKAPLYAWLTSGGGDEAKAGEVKWNFEKFLVGRDGKLLARFPSKVAPEDPEFVAALERALSAD